MICDHFNNNGYFQQVVGRKLTDDEARTIKVAWDQSEQLYDAYQAGRTQDPPYADGLYQAWLDGGHDFDNLMQVFRVLKDQLAGGGQVEPPIIPDSNPGPVPSPVYGPGLTLILDLPNSKKEAFCHLNGYTGLYGLHQGGAEILNPDGTSFIPKPERESIFQLLDPGDGQLLAITEHYASVFKRINGEWKEVYNSLRQQDLALGICQTANGWLWVVANGFDNNTSRLILSVDVGFHWSAHKTFPNMTLQGICTDGRDVVLSGGDGESQLLVDGITGEVIERYPNNEGYSNWGVAIIPGSAPLKQRIISGTWNCTDKADGCYINMIGASLMPPLWYPNGKEYDKPLGTFVQAGGTCNGVPYFVITHGWDETAGESLLVKYAGGKRIEIVTKIPCAHIMGMNFTPDGKGVFLSGGVHDKNAKVFHYTL
jgi:hypothetical protein